MDHNKTTTVQIREDSKGFNELSNKLQNPFKNCATNSQLTSLPMCGFIAQLVEHCTGIVEVMGSNPVGALNFF